VVVVAKFHNEEYSPGVVYLKIPNFSPLWRKDSMVKAEAAV
jgi:hypothetical protein